jgi:transcriptional regulator with XRE-family HTH domain
MNHARRPISQKVRPMSINVRTGKSSQKTAKRVKIEGFAERLRKALIAQDIGDVAKKVGVSRSSFYKWLAGQFEPSLSQLVTFCSITNVTLDWLISGRGEMRPGEIAGYVKPAYPLAPSWPPLILENTWLAKNIPRVSFPLILIDVPDDAMEPTLRKGDLVIGNREFPSSPTNGLYLVTRNRAREGERVVPYRAADNLFGFELDPEHARPARPNEDIGEVFVLDLKGHFLQRFFPRRVEWSASDSAIIKCDNPAYSEVIEITDPKKQGMAVAGHIVWHSRFI